jgi:hypothetical protein
VTTKVTDRSLFFKIVYNIEVGEEPGDRTSMNRLV